jgi:AcrR family transcriptional regulator
MAAEADEAPRRRGPGRPTGRRGSAPDTRRLILEAARAEFARTGYAGTSVRGIARSAGVDPALVHHYFGPKSRVFIAALDLPLDPDEVVPHMLAGGPGEMGERLARYFLALWEDPQLQPRLLGMLRTALAGDEASALIRDFLAAHLVERVARDLGLTDGVLRVGMCAAELSGVACARYVLALEPLASADAEVIVAAVGPTLQRYLDGETSSAAWGGS